LIAAEIKKHYHLGQRSRENMFLVIKKVLLNDDGLLQAGEITAVNRHHTKLFISVLEKNDR
jgi:hypothetical protein